MQVIRFDKKDAVNPKFKKNLGADDTLFHAGGNTMTGSAGCQTMAPLVFKKGTGYDTAKIFDAMKGQAGLY